MRVQSKPYSDLPNPALMPIEQQGEPSARFCLARKNTTSPFADMRGHHVAVRTSSLAEAKDFYVGKLDFRIVAEWPFADEQLALLVAVYAIDHFYIEVLGGGDKLPTEVRPLHGSWR